MSLTLPTLAHYSGRVYVMQMHYTVHSCVEQCPASLPTIEPIEANTAAAIAVSHPHSWAFKWYSVAVFSVNAHHSQIIDHCTVSPYGSFRTIQTLTVCVLAWRWPIRMRPFVYTIFCLCFPCTIYIRVLSLYGD